MRSTEKRSGYCANGRWRRKVMLGCRFEPTSGEFPNTFSKSLIFDTACSNSTGNFILSRRIFPIFRLNKPARLGSAIGNHPPSCMGRVPTIYSHDLPKINVWCPWHAGFAVGSWGDPGFAVPAPTSGEHRVNDNRC